ncbi:hypothetical protein AAKU67_003043 [Oxalobacteraceae bacterium GrIS 2.11]
MDLLMNGEKLKGLASELAKDIKIEAYLNVLSKELLKLTAARKARRKSRHLSA